MIKINKMKFNKFIFISMVISVYVVSYYIREGLLNNFATFNFIFIFSLFLYIIFNFKSINFKLFIWITFIIIYIIFIDIAENKNSIESIFRSLSMYIIPMYLLTINIEKKSIKEIMSSVLSLINIFTIVIFIIGIIDPFLRYKIMNFLGSYLLSGLKNLIYENTILNEYRYTSYMGHALFTKELFIYFYLLNIIYFKKFKKTKLNITLVTFISLIGILLTGSKTGTVLILICILFTNYKKSKFINFIIGSLILVGSYLAGFFNTVMYRLNNETLTSGRYQAGEMLNNLSIIKVKIFSGYGEYVDRKISCFLGDNWTTAALEYPYKILFFKYGLLCTLFIFYTVFIFPIVEFIKNKEYYILFAFLIKVIDINTYNGIIFKPDNMILFLIFTIMLINLCRFNKEDIRERHD